MPHLLCNAAKLYYIDTGSGKEIILFSHGLLFTHDMFLNQVNYFSKLGYRCIAYDHRGQGQSELTTAGYDMDNLYEDAVSLIEQLNIAPVHFVGLSMGGFVGMRIAARKPYLLKSLSLLETSPDEETNKFKYRIMVFLVRLFGTRIVTNSLMKVMMAKSFLNDPQKKVLREKIASGFASLPKSITRAVDGVINRKGLYDEITNIQLPTLIIVGEEDMAAVPAKAERIHQQIKNSRLVYIKKAGHSSTIEEPEQVNLHLQEFLKLIF